MGRPGLVAARCVHRGTTLYYYGRVEARGIRCCYHGWLFDVEGPLPGAAVRARRRHPARADAPAVVPGAERFGLLFAYLGPPERKPALPRWEPLEILELGERLETDASSIGGGGPVIIPCNWLQHYENLMDSLHVPILHGAFSGMQFTEVMGLMPQVTWDLSDKGVKAISRRPLPDGRLLHRISEAVLPTLRGRAADAARGR